MSLRAVLSEVKEQRGNLEIASGLRPSQKNGVSSIFGPSTTLFNYFNESKIELTPFFIRNDNYV